MVIVSCPVLSSAVALSHNAKYWTALFVMGGLVYGLSFGYFLLKHEGWYRKSQRGTGKSWLVKTLSNDVFYFLLPVCIVFFASLSSVYVSELIAKVFL